jgi:RND family efflux transporter MFP subunit
MKGRAVRASGFIALGLLAGCGRGDAPGAPPAPDVTVAVAQLGAVPDRREYVGNVRAVNQVDVRARVRGYLRAKHFDEGQLVTAGAVLFEIDPSSYEVALAGAKGQLAQARATVVRAEADYKRTKGLFDQGVTSASVLDQARADRDVAAASLQSAEAAVDAAQLDLSYCTVRAPLTGRIGRALVDVGNLVGESGQDTVLATIVQENPIYVYFAPTERDRLDVLRGATEGRIPQQRAGTIPIEIVLGDGSPYRERGVIDYVDPTIEPTRGTITVRAIIANPGAVLKPGQFVRAIAVFPDRTDAVLIPERAVQEEQGGSFVLVVKPDDVVESRRVRTGALYQGMRQILEGLAAGDRVIVDGVQKARPGSKVNPSTVAAVPAEAKADEKAQARPAEPKSAAKAGGK